MLPGRGVSSAITQLCLAWGGHCPYLVCENWWVPNTCKPSHRYEIQLSAKLLSLIKPQARGHRGHRGQSHLGCWATILRCGWGTSNHRKGISRLKPLCKISWSTSLTCQQTAAQGYMGGGGARSHDPRISCKLSKAPYMLGVTWLQPSQIAPLVFVRWTLFLGFSQVDEDKPGAVHTQPDSWRKPN